MSDHPDDDELEISLFGPGLGESVVIHVGGGEWTIVDSCRNPATGRPVAVEYLERLDVDCASAVSTLVVTHWDSDHIRGIGDVAAACPQATVWCTSAIDNAEFDVLLDTEDDHPGATAGRLRELAHLRRACKERTRRQPGIDWTSSRKRLLIRREDEQLPRRELWALSPSSHSLTLTMHRLSHVFREDSGPLADEVKRMRRNDASSALMLCLGERGALLGADLEYTPDDRCGWLAAIPVACELDVAADFVKLPHHGSDDAHCDEMWSDVLIDHPAAAVTPWRSGGNELPRDTDRDRIRHHTDRAYLTSPSPRVTDDDTLLHAVEDMNAVPLEGHFGHVRWRRPMTRDGQWTVALDDISCVV